MTDLRDGYYAVLDPSTPATMTYWRAHGSRLTAWPAKAWHGPARPLKRDAPADHTERIAWMRAWQERYQAWLEMLHAALDADPGMARRQFAEFATRCCLCGRTLRDEKSKCLGIGPECRRDMSDAALAQLLTPAVAAAHATHTTGPLTIPAPPDEEQRHDQHQQ